MSVVEKTVVLSYNKGFAETSVKNLCHRNNADGYRLDVVYNHQLSYSRPAYKGVLIFSNKTQQAQIETKK